jgi:hypothetical protein
LKELRDAGHKWDAAFDQLASVTDNYLAAFTRLQACHPTPDQYRQIENARVAARHIVDYKLRAFFINGGALALSPEAGRLAQLVNHLPEPQE